MHWLVSNMGLVIEMSNPFRAVKWTAWSVSDCRCLATHRRALKHPSLHHRLPAPLCFYWTLIDSLPHSLNSVHLKTFFFHRSLNIMPLLLQWKISTCILEIDKNSVCTHKSVTGWNYDWNKLRNILGQMVLVHDLNTYS